MGSSVSDTSQKIVKLQAPKLQATQAKVLLQEQGTEFSELISKKHLAYFYKYGFVVVRGLHTKDQIDLAKKGAQSLLFSHNSAVDKGKGEQAFSFLPQGERSSWGRCVQPNLMKYFDYPENKSMCEKFIGPFQFKHRNEGPGYFTFAPRFYSWNINPKAATKDSQVQLLQPYDLNNLPKDFSEWSVQFLEKSKELGIEFAPTKDNNWHIDGVDYNTVASFSMLWGSYINALPKGNMGNLNIMPGTHHVIANMFKKQGKTFHYDGKKQKAKPLPNLEQDGISDGRLYSLIVEAGDIVLAHPWVAHGININLSKEIRLAVYCRMQNDQFYVKQRSKMAGQELPLDFSKGLPQPKFWKGDYWENVPLLNKWFKQNKDILKQYDSGRLQKYLLEMDKRKK